MGGTVKIESEGLGTGTVFIIEMRAITKVTNDPIKSNYKENLRKKISL